VIAAARGLRSRIAILEVSWCFESQLKSTSSFVLISLCFGFAVVTAPATLEAGEAQNRTTVLLHQL
jgi:hypothetical protein